MNSPHLLPPGKSQRNLQVERLSNGKNGIIVIGGGLTGLSAGYVLTRAGLKVRVLERDSVVGGLSRTVFHNGFRFDLGGHRFFTKDDRINSLVRELMGGELISVPRKSKIYMQGKYFDYPLRPMNAMLGLGIPTTVKIFSDYVTEKARGIAGKPPPLSLEDWVVGNFGRTMFNIYFKVYSEKVWGVDCSRISAEWVAQRIRGLSLAKAVKNAFFKFSGKDIPSLVDRFEYPRLGIGRISDRLREDIEERNEVSTGTGAVRVHHRDFRITGVEIMQQGRPVILPAEEVVSSMPITTLVKMLDPAPPAHILDAASRLKFRDLVVVTVMIDRKRVTDQTWIYIPEERIAFGRIHEPANWSEDMSPEGKTSIVAEFFSFKGDKVWNMADRDLIRDTAEGLERLGFIRKHEVIDGIVVRAPKAYPLFEIGYKELCDTLYDYLGRFGNLHIAGRSGVFKYYNMDHAIESGMETAEKIIAARGLD